VPQETRKFIKGTPAFVQILGGPTLMSTRNSKTNMCDTISTSMTFGALSLLPGNRYIPWVLVSAWLIVYTANRQRPSYKLRRVEQEIKVAEETSVHAKAHCPRSYVDLMNTTRRLLE
jgi:hypothetical protein